jgi:two-component system, NtrC family, sensor kinase
VSLRVQITAIYGAILVVTMSVAASLGQSIAKKAVEQALRDRAVDVAYSIVADLDLPTDLSKLDREAVGDRLAEAVPLHRALRRADLTIVQGARRELFRIDLGSGGPELSFDDPPPNALETKASSSVEREGDERIARVVVPVLGADRKPFANLRVEVDLSDAAAIARRERTVFVWVTGVSALVLAFAFTLVLGRMLARPLRQLASAMERVESGAQDVAPIPGAARSDEIGVVARGLEAMLARLGGFNHELQLRIAAATADLGAKNRALAEANRQLVAARRDLDAKERLAALGQLSGTIAHELGNPLNALSGHVQLLFRAPDCPPAIREQLAIVDREAKRMTAIIRRFLDSARALTPAPEPVDLATLVDEVLSLSVSAETHDRIAVSREIAPEVARVALDPALVRHVLTNFVSNALDAMPAGGRLAVRAFASGGSLAVTVADTGFGIGPEERKRIFEPFYSTKAPGKGSGLGLAICREIASALKGHIEVETAPGAGSAFTLYVPLPAAAGTPGEASWTRRSSG